MPILTPALSLAALVSVTSPTPGEDWRPLVRNDRYMAGVDADSIRSEGEIVRALLITVPLPEPEEGVRALMVMGVEIHCSDARERVVSRRLIDLDGTDVWKTVESDAAWDEVRSDTPVGALEAVLCDAKPLDVRSSADPAAFGRFALKEPPEAD